jgi:CPA1 family monovalent cation:H+ antiporter
MGLFNILALLLALTALFSYLNHRTLRLPTTIGVMLISLVFSLALVAIGALLPGTDAWARELVANLHFDETLLHGMLSFLLFAGAIHVNFDDLYRNKWIIGTLATVGTLMSTAIVGVVSWWLLAALAIPVPFIFCLLFGALISPTDPIAVLSILKSVGAPKSLETKITGESLFNDGIGVVVFIVLLGFAGAGHGSVPPGAGEIAVLFLQEVVGGAIFGAAIGYGSYWMIKSVDSYDVEILITLALVTAGYAAANALHLSGPIAIVVAGLLIGNHGRRLAMSEKTRRHIDLFWELIDEILNAVLFVLIGLEIIVLTYTMPVMAAALMAIPLVLTARLIAVSLPVWILRHFRTFTPGAIRLMTWGGLRGGISVALALSLPGGEEREIILPITYTVVVFSIFVQATTIRKLVRSILPTTDAEQ